jgi:hypothetical protein
MLKLMAEIISGLDSTMQDFIEYDRYAGLSKILFFL